MAPLFGLRWAVPLALLSGLTMWLAFSPVAFGPYAIASVALLTAAAWRSTRSSVGPQANSICRCRMRSVLLRTGGAKSGRFIHHTLSPLASTNFN